MFWLRSRETITRCLLAVAMITSSCREPDDLVAPPAQLVTADEELTVLRVEPSSARRCLRLIDIVHPHFCCVDTRSYRNRPSP